MLFFFSVRGGWKGEVVNCFFPFFFYNLNIESYFALIFEPCTCKLQFVNRKFQFKRYIESFFIIHLIQ